MSPRSSIEDIFTDGVRSNNRYPMFGRYKSPIPYVITSPPQQPISKTDAPDDVSDDDDDDDDDDVISLSTIPEVPSVMAGTLSPSEFLELGPTLSNKYGRHRAAVHKRRSKPDKVETPAHDVDNVGIHVTSDDPGDLDKSMTSRRRRLRMLLSSVVVVFVIVLVAIIVIVIVLGESSLLYFHSSVTHICCKPSCLLPVFSACCRLTSSLP